MKRKILIRRVLDYFIAYRPETPSVQGTGSSTREALGQLFWLESKRSGDVDIMFEMRHEYTNAYVVMNGLNPEVL